jgi:hypothetical protein
MSIQQRSSKLVWNAPGLLRATMGVEGNSLTYEFTVLARDDGSIVANVDQGNPNNQFCAPDGTRH